MCADGALMGIEGSPSGIWKSSPALYKHIPYYSSLIGKASGNICQILDIREILKFSVKSLTAKLYPPWKEGLEDPSPIYISSYMYWYQNGFKIANWLIKTCISFKLNWIEFINPKNGKHISQISKIFLSCSLLRNVL